MEVFKIAASKYSEQLTASGRPNRWNKKGEFVIYTSSTRSLASLELIVHRGSIKPTLDHEVMILSLPDDSNFQIAVQTKNLPKDLKNLSAYNKIQKIGSQWYQEEQSLILKVPSAVIHYEFNHIINTMHSDFEKYVQLVRTECYFWDERLPL